MTNTQILQEKGCYFPSWINSEDMITKVTTLEGQELYEAFGFKDSTSCSKFLSRFFPGKGKSVRFNNYVKVLLA
jgi:hypothetical protein